jgi:alkanesulfonate monooxygenase SsuD/methylene tetrahydromethanopterin reductase-like flavin-dependent oxidoreductase (luciferase family)
MRYAIGVPNVREFADARLVAELAADAEAAGWDGLFLWDHLLYRDRAPVVNPWVALTAAALATQRVRLAVLVVNVARRRPGQLALEAVSLDRLSGGRLILGAGLGSLPEEWSAFGEDPDARVRAQKLDEGLDALALLWSGEQVGYRGRHVRLDGAVLRPTPLQRPRIPIWIGGRWPNQAPFRRAARWDGVMPIHADYGSGETMPPAELRRIVDTVRRHRDDDGAFDVAVEGRTGDGGDARADAERVEAYGQVGLTWWIEALGWWRGPLAAARRRIGQGPPRA